MLTLDKVYHAKYVLKPVIRETDVIHAPKINPEAQIFLKTENLQITGSFKVRGAYYKMSCLSDEEKSKGVIACSAGNHAQGVALAAKKNGIRAVICLPDGAPISKVEATKSYGAEVCLVNGVYDDAYAEALRQRDEYGYTFIHPFDDENVIAGQGTIGLELLEQIPDVDAVIVPIGGGGLISGVAFAVKSLNPNVKVYGVQATGAPSMFNSIKDGKIERLDSVSTIADGIYTRTHGTAEARYRGRRSSFRSGSNVQQSTDKGQKGSLPALGRKYRRYHSLARYQARTPHDRQDLLHEYRAYRQARSAS